jgi:protein required for attachment to host cells
MNTVWILVCDASRGRLFEIRGEGGAWHQVEAFAHGESREKAGDLVTDRMGRSSSEGASSHHSALAPASSPKEVEKGHFGHTLAKMLDEALRTKRFRFLVLAAPPHFLGMLKKELTPELEKHLLATVDKDLSHLAPTDIAKRMQEVVRIPLDKQETLFTAGRHAH